MAVNDIRRLQVEKALIQVRKGKRRKRYWRPVICTVAACFLILRFVLGISLVSGMSMSPALMPKDVVFSLRMSAPPKAGEIVIIREPSGAEIVKRVAATAGDTLDITPDGHLIRNGKLVSEPDVLYGEQDTSQWIHFPILLPEGTLFCLGDNRPVSLDSRDRSIGPIPLKTVKGRVVFVLRSQH